MNSNSHLCDVVIVKIPISLSIASIVNNKCCVEISDNGAGISKDALGKIFEPYFTGKSKGTGLGLTSTQNIIFNHQGTIDVESEEGKGSTFIITLNFADRN